MNRLLVAGFFITLFLLSIRPLRDFDIWFHVKSGEIFIQQGIIHTDVFSHTAQGRRWYPYEWLYQMSMYGVQELFGFEAIKVVTAGFVTVTILFLWKIMTEFFRASAPVAVFVSFFFFVSVYEFFTSRPHIPAYMLFVMTLYILLSWIRGMRHRLLFLIPIFLVWGNFHGSIFVGIALILAYACVAFLLRVITKEPVYMKRGQVLLAAVPVAILLTILPPVGTIQYELLWEFYKNIHLIRTFIDEWTPLSSNPYAFVFYSLSAGSIMLGWIWSVFKTRHWQTHLLLLPLVPFPLLAFTASRNIFFGYIALCLLLIDALRVFVSSSYHKRYRWLTIGLGIVLVAVHLWILTQKRIPERLYFPVNAVNFIKAQQLSGNMFNEYGYGGYLLYHLYPERKVFFDGRTDVYLCCEIKETLELAKKKHLQDSEYKKLLDALWENHDISYVILRTQKHSILRKIAAILSDDAAWALVFWDDHSQIFVRRDGKNDAVIAAFGSSFATPYGRNPFVANHETEAYSEYERMINVVDSARSRNAIGFIRMKQDQLDAAKIEFEKAIALDPSFESPYMNIAELALHAGNPHTAITLYKQAVKLAPDRGLAYLRLAQIMLETSNNTAEVARLLRTGITNTVDEDARIQLRQFLETIQ